MSQALYLKWRPQNWQDVIGQKHVVDTLHNALAGGHIVHAYLFAGPRGTGKTTTARLLAKAVNCLDANLEQRPCGSCELCLAVNQGRFMDLIEIDAASNTSVDDVRDLRDKINFSPSQGRYKVYIIDEVHMLSTAAFNALLKTLEEPPPHAIFVLATTEVHKIPATVLSRCQRHEFRRIPVLEIVSQLEKIAQGEGIQFEAEALTLIARQATGAMRDAISLLDQLASTGNEITLQTAQEVLGVATSQSVIDLVQALIDQESGAGLDQIHTTLDSGADACQFARQIVDYLRNLLLIHMENAEYIEAAADIRAFMAQQANAFRTPELLRLIKIFNRAATEVRNNWHPALPLEMAFVEAICGEPSFSVAQKTEAPTTKLMVEMSEQRKSSSMKHKLTVEPKTGPIPTTKVETKGLEKPQQISKAWRQFLLEVKRNSAKTYALLNSCKSHFMQNDQLIINFATEIVRNMMEKPENMQVAQEAIQKILERSVVIQCQVATIDQDSLPPGTDDDGMVASALRDLGGKVINNTETSD